ncbi:RxLR effector protein, partial [Phytophthora megakarya]
MQLQRWLAKKKSPNSVFTFMMLDKQGGQLLSNPQIDLWLKYVDDFNLKSPNKVTSPISTLEMHYQDEMLSHIIIEAQKILNTKNIATILQGEQIQRWLSSKKSPYNVFELFQLVKASDKLLDSLQFVVWVKYVDKFNKQNPDNQYVHYGDDVLVKMVEVAKTHSDTKKIVTRLETERLWNEETYFF